MSKFITGARLIKLPEIMAAILLIAGLGLILANVIGRYVFNNPIIWAEEIMIYILVWCVFLGCLQGVINNTHLNMDLIVNLLPKGIKFSLEMLISIVGGLSCALVSWVSSEAFILMWQNDQVSLVAGIPMTIPHGAILLGFAMMSLASFYNVFRQFSKRKSVEMRIDN